MRDEAIIPEYVRITADHFVEGSDYSTYRSEGTQDWLLIHTRAGGGVFGSREGTAHPAGPGQVTLLLPGARHDYRTDSQVGQWDFFYAHFRARGDWQSLLAWPELTPGMRQLTVSGEIRRQVEANLAEAARWSHSMLRQNGLLGLNRLEAALLWCDVSNPLSDQGDERIRAVVDAVERNLARTWGLPELASVAGLSPSRLSHLFRDQWGVSPREFVEQRRMSLAAQLLDLTSRSVSDIAAAVGFHDPLYFSTRFRKHFDLSPRSYRRREVPPEEPS